MCSVSVLAFGSTLVTQFGDSNSNKWPRLLPHTADGGLEGTFEQGSQPFSMDALGSTRARHGAQARSALPKET